MCLIHAKADAANKSNIVCSCVLPWSPRSVVQPPTTAPPPHPRGNEIIEYPPLNKEIAKGVRGYGNSTIAKTCSLPVAQPEAYMLFLASELICRISS